MENKPPPLSVIEAWKSGRVSFNAARRSYSLTHWELAICCSIPMPKHVVSIRSTFEDWPQEDQDRIVEAQSLYDNGVVEMVTGRTPNHFILYAIPRKKKINRDRKYFGVNQ